MRTLMVRHEPASPPLPGAAEPGQEEPVSHAAIVEDLRAAEELLDQLERAGWAHRQLSVLDGGVFEVRWR